MILVLLITVGTNVAISSGIFWISAAVVTQVTPIIVDSALGIAGFLSLLIGFTIVSIFVVLVGLPETNVSIKMPITHTMNAL